MISLTGLSCLFIHQPNAGHSIHAFRIFGSKLEELQKISDIVLIGAGNVASNLGLALHKAGLNIMQVYSRSSASAKELAQNLQASFTTELESVEDHAQLYIISLPDNALRNVIEQMNTQGKFLVHTSGAVPMQIFEEKSHRFGVFYPLQTFSKQRELNFQQIPICLEANNEENLNCLKELAGRLSHQVRIIPSDQRKVLHLAAVFACNFPNYMYSVAESIIQHANLDFELLKPLILETAEKVQSIKPSDAQTGPALRKDTRVMNKHKEMLIGQPEIRELYELISKYISKM